MGDRIKTPASTCFGVSIFVFEIYMGLVISNFYEFSFVFEIDSRWMILNFSTSIFVFEIDMEVGDIKFLYFYICV